MEILAMLVSGALIMGLIWLIVREDPQDKLMREYRAKQFIETLREAEAFKAERPKIVVDTRPARSYSTPTPRSTSSSRSSSSRSSSDDSWVSTSSIPSWGGDSGGSSSSSSCDSSSSSSSSPSCD